MAEAAVSFGAYQRTGNPTLAALNCYAEEYPSASGKRVQMRSRPGLEDFKTVGSNAFRGAHQKDGLFESTAIIVNGTTVYTLSAGAMLTAQAGTLLGDELVDIDSGQESDLTSAARFATGSALYKLHGGALTLEDFPDVGGAGASSVCYHRGYWIATEAGTDKFYFQVPGDTTWDPLSFASSEYAPDALVAVRSRGDQIALMGSATFEVFTLSGDASNPIVPYGGLNFDHGCRARPTAINCKGSLLYVDNECNVRRWDGGEPLIVSGAGMAEQIRAVAAADLRAWTFSVDGQRFYVLTLGTASTWVYSLSGPGERWCTFGSLGYGYWRASLGCSIGDVTLACDVLSPQVWRLDQTRRTDGDDQFEVVFCAMVEGQDRPQPCDNVVVVCDLGDAPREGQGSAPVMQMQVSDDQGKTFGQWFEEPMGATGDFASLPRFNSLGDIPAFFGRILQFRVSDPVGRIFKRVWLNAP